MTTTADDPIGRMMDFILAYCRSQGLGTIARLGVPDALRDGPKTAARLAGEVRCDEDALRRFMSALAVEGVSRREDDGSFSLTPLSEGLTTDHPRSVRWLAAAMCGHAHWHPWGKAYEVVKEGRSQTEKVLGASPWEYLSGSPEEAGRFGRG